jgi:hypothetical protein
MQRLSLGGAGNLAVRHCGTMMPFASTGVSTGCVTVSDLSPRGEPEQRRMSKVRPREAKGIQCVSL